MGQKWLCIKGTKSFLIKPHSFTVQPSSAEHFNIVQVNIVVLRPTNLASLFYQTYLQVQKAAVDPAYISCLAENLRPAAADECSLANCS